MPAFRSDLCVFWGIGNYKVKLTIAGLAIFQSHSFLSVIRRIGCSLYKSWIFFMAPDRPMPRQILARPHNLRSLKVSILTCPANITLSGLFAVAFLRLIPYFTFFTFLIFYRISSPFAIAHLSQRPKIFSAYPDNPSGFVILRRSRRIWPTRKRFFTSLRFVQNDRW